jgi:translation initiation factor 3 subunit M
MLGPTNTLLIEGSFAELADELAQYIDTIRKTQSEGSSLQAEIAQTLELLREQEQAEEEPSSTQNQQILKQRDDVLKKLVIAAVALNAAPEKGESFVFSLLCEPVRGIFWL